MEKIDELKISIKILKRSIQTYTKELKESDGDKLRLIVTDLKEEVDQLVAFLDELQELNKL